LKVFHTPIAGYGDAHKPPVPQERIMNTFRRSLAVAGAFAALTVATTSFAGAPSADSLTVAVRYDDLNLSTSAGANALYHRISVAAREVCPEVVSRDMRVAAASKRCQASAVAHAVRDVNNPQLALVHAAHVSHG
jgi:UrcA family protein